MLDVRFARSRRKRSPTTLLVPSFVGSWTPLLAVAATLAVSSAARAAEHELARVTATTLSLEVGGAALLAGSMLLLPAPERCRWCEPPALDEWLAMPAGPTARRISGRMSHVFSYALIPAVVTAASLVPPLTTSESDDHAYQNLGLVTEVVMVDLALTLAIKSWSARRRPAFYYGRAAYTEYAENTHEGNVSFFSGDTSAAFAGASAAATISFLRGYRSAPYVTAAGATLATATGLLRLGADVHWPSDVLAGAVVGAGLGIALPLLLHPRQPSSSGASESTRAKLTPGDAPDAAMVRFSGAF